MECESVIQSLVHSDEPSVRYSIRLKVLDEDAGTASMRALQEEIRTSERVHILLSEQMPDGSIPRRAYFKWAGPHWVLAMLAEMGYPAGDAGLLPLREQEYAWLLGDHHVIEYEKKRRKFGPERIRRCASQEGYAVYALHKLGLEDERLDILAARLLECQWPDGGWNCDVTVTADTSSFHESWIPLRALSALGRSRQDSRLLEAASWAAEIFLQRSMFRRLHGGEIINQGFLSLYYPFYWRYTVLSGLKAIMEAGMIRDPRCNEALDWLESRQLAGGGFPADTKFYRVTENPEISGGSLAGWGKANGKDMNEFVTAEALAVLHAAGRV